MARNRKTPAATTTKTPSTSPNSSPSSSQRSSPSSNQSNNSSNTTTSTNPKTTAKKAHKKRRQQIRNGTQKSTRAPSPPRTKTLTRLFCGQLVIHGDTEAHAYAKGVFAREFEDPGNRDLVLWSDGFLDSNEISRRGVEE